MKLLSEIKNLLIDFIKPCGINDEVVKIPKNVKKMGTRVEIFSFVSTLIALIFAFTLKLTNMMIELRLLFLGVIFFLLYKGEDVLRDAFYIYEDSEKTKFDLIFDDEIVYRGSNIIGKTRNKVLKYDDKNRIYKVLSNESSLNTIKNYLDNLWRQEIKHRFDILQILSVILMLITAIFTNSTIPNTIFIPLIIFFSFISFLSSAYINLNRNTFFKKHREYNNEQSLIVNDLLRVPSIVNKDLDMRINKFKDTVINSNKNVKNFYKKMNISRFFVSLIETLCNYGIIIFYIVSIKLSNLTLANITEITATLVIIETAMGYIRRFVYALDYNSERINKINTEEEDMKLILDIYHSITNEKPKVVDNIIVKPFTISYKEESKNDIPFTLKSRETININSGEVIILYGPSGSGKSTFMNMLTERIKLEKSVEIPSTTRFLFYDEKLKFGSLNMFDELFCSDKNPDLNKMEDILRNLNLWNEIESNSHDVWEFFKEKQFEHSLSNGQRQRLILAKMLYFLDENIDALILDEPTSGLDDKNNIGVDAENILEYVVRYSNKDKKRIIIISTHQNIDGFKDKIKEEYKVRDYIFLKENNENIIKEIY